MLVERKTNAMAHSAQEPKWAFAIRSIFDSCYVIDRAEIFFFVAVC